MHTKLRGALFCMLTLVVATAAVAAPVEFYDTSGNLLVGCDVLAFGDQVQAQKFTGDATSTYNVAALSGTKVTFRVSDPNNDWHSTTVVIPEELQGPMPITVARVLTGSTCATPTAAAVPSVSAGTTVGAPDSPEAFFCGTSVTIPSAGQWYSVGGTGTVLNASTCNDANYDTKLSVYCQDCDNLTCVNGNDDGAGCAGFTSSVDFCADGDGFLVFVHGFGSATGDYNLTLTDLGTACSNGGACEPPPVTGACCTDNCDVLVGATPEVIAECARLSCTQETTEDCLASGGVYNGDDTACVEATGEVLIAGVALGTPIPDNDPTGAREEVVIPGPTGDVFDMDVDLNITHSWIGDLSVILTHKDTGTAVALWSRNCGASSNLTILADDEGTQTFCGAAFSPTTGSIPPALTNGFTSALSDFDSESAAGTWSLVVDDNFTADTGSITSWDLIIALGASNCPGCGGGDDEDEDEDADDGSDDAYDNNLDAYGRTTDNRMDGMLELDRNDVRDEGQNSTRGTRGERTSRRSIR
jgi:subtilisin-like proprotein convertase family protein